jgi:hypothetical protein
VFGDLWGTPYSDTLIGGPGPLFDDLYIHGDLGPDWIDMNGACCCAAYGDDGNDVIYGSPANQGSNGEYLEGGWGSDELHGLGGDDHLLDLSPEADQLIGNSGSDLLNARDGSSVADDLEGGPEDEGTDTCWGDTGQNGAAIDSYSDDCSFFGDPGNFPNWPNG